ncbi:MAG: rhodanese-like domain-containing protein [candidate division Zixibacteria bacterium]|nr:rhodanese-like domain-containing protein [candidate division Zixibacteria bacterium]
MVLFKQLMTLLILSVVLAFGSNLVLPNSIPFVGEYRSISSSGEPIVPPSAELGDPPFIDLNRARFEYDLGTAIFLDSRSPEEFDCGTIPGSINIPFEYMPDGDLTEYLDSAFSGAAFDKTIINYCSGEECDLSLYMGRFLNTSGYTNVMIFFGGSREWEQAGFEVERRVKCDN